MNRCLWFSSVALLIGTSAQSAHGADRPNVLIIMADDCTYSDLPVYGGKNARTPNIDQMATQGLTFNRAYLSEAMCQPCRAELDHWLVAQGDPGDAQDTQEAIQAARQGKHLYYPPRAR